MTGCLPPAGPRIPLVDLGREYQAHRQEILAAIDRVLSGSRFYLGPETTALEGEFAAMTKVKEAVAVGSGTDALIFALRALGLGPGDEVIVPSFTFIATVAAIVHTGARPVLVDVDRRSFNIDPAAAARALSRRTRGLLAVHLFGRPAPMADLRDLATRHDLWLVEDACQAHGATSSGRPVGGLGQAGCFSFVFTKNLHGYGDGGMVTTDDPTLADTVRKLRDHGREDHYRHSQYGFCSRLDEIQSAIIRVFLRDLEIENERRRVLARRYGQALTGRRDIVVPEAAPPGDTHVYHRYVPQATDRDRLARHLGARGVDTGVNYPLACHQQPAALTMPHRLGPGGCPVSEEVASRVLSIPLFPSMTTEEQDRVIAGILEADDESAPAADGDRAPATAGQGGPGAKGGPSR
jgi:dTDP-4-amino-4,6-dideoxygalactose transaminase